MSAAPTNIRLLRAERILEITWPEGHVSRFPLKHLRCECPCAGCVNEFTGERTLKPETVPEDVSPTHMELSGNYALKVTWSDGHNTGLYSWENLRRLAGSN